VLTGDGGGGQAGRGSAREVLTGDGRVARTGGHARRRLELVARAKESAKELGREGMRCGESRGSHRPFIGAGGRTGEGGRGSNSGVNGINAIEGGGEVKRGD
jgi:hypothetical protein